MGASSEGPPIEFRLLGPFEVVAGGQVLEIGSAKQRTLLAMLALRPNQVVSFDALVEELWGERPPPSVSAGVQVLVSRLRGSLSEASLGSGDSLRAKEPGYVLEVDPAQVDAHRFDTAAARGRDALAQGCPEIAVTALGEALSLWRGPALADLADRRFARIEAVRLDEARLVAVEELAEAELAIGRPRDAVARLEAHVAEHPLREGAWGRLMVALYRCGRQAEALRCYQEVRRILAEELGLEPTPALRALEAQILAQAPELDGAGALEREAKATSPPAPREPASVLAAARPEDTVVFLFTDIEASTRRWEGDHGAMAEDLARHDDLLREAATNAQGRVFAHTGDGLCAAFPTARAALAAALEGQRNLLGETWASPAPLRVRMAIHAGVAEPRGENYVGPALNRAARLLSLAGGGQVLCSQSATELLRDDLPEGVTLVDAGEHPLADLSRPERVFQVAHADLPAGLSLRSLGRSRHNLPTALTTFVGRTREIEEVLGLLKASRLVTLAGVGGSGKTRLALELARRLLDEYPEGVWVVDLAPVGDPDLVASTVATTLGLVATGHPEALRERLCEHLRQRRVLLVLDNCEHLVEACADLALGVLRGCPPLTVLATSREILGLPGETPWRVPLLSLPSAEATSPEDLEDSDAVALFCERAQASQPGFAVTPGNAAAVNQVCRRLDGLPLALELAAARIRVLGAVELAARLDQRFALLTGGTRAALPRHQTLRATMDWSYELLPAGEAALLRRLAVFPASFDLETAEAVGQGSEASEDEVGYAVLDRFSRLVDKSLVVVESEGPKIRYRLLETVKEYAWARAEPEEREAARRCHRDFFLRIATTHDDPDDPVRRFGEEWMVRSEADYESFRTALEWSTAQGEDEAALRLAGALFASWNWSRLGEGADLLGRVLSRPPPPIPAGVETLAYWGFVLYRSGRASLARAEEPLRAALELGLVHDYRASTAVARYLLGELRKEEGDLEEAKQLHLAALEDCEATGSDVLAGWCHHGLGWVALHSGDVASAQKHFERSLTLATGAGFAMLRLHVLASLAPLAAVAGETERAKRLANDAREMAHRTPLRAVRVMALARAAEAAVLSGARDRAELVLTELVGALVDLGARAWVAETLEMVAIAAEGRGAAEAAARLLGSCWVVREAAGEDPGGGSRLLSGLVEGCRRRLVETLGPDGFGEQEALGRATSMPDALRCALQVLQSPEGTSRWVL